MQNIYINIIYNSINSYIMGVNIIVVLLGKLIFKKLQTRGK